MTSPSRFDEITERVEHCEAVHPWRELVQHRFYLGDLVTSEGGLWIALTDALLIIPLIMAAFFYPWQALVWVAVLAVVSFVAYEVYAVWQRRHPRVRDAEVTGTTG